MMRGALGCLFLLLVPLVPGIARAEIERGRAPAEPRPFRDIRCLSPDGVLPATSDLFTFHDHSFVKLPCPRPTMAAIAGAFAREEDAVRLLAQLRGRDLPFGYPVVAHPNALWLPLPGKRIAVVAALFLNRRAADAWQQRHPGFTQVRIVPGNDLSPTVIRFIAPDGVPAFGLRDAIRLSRASIERRRPPQAAPACQVAGDALFVFSEKQLSDAVYGKNYVRVDTDDRVFFLPVRCADSIRYVDVRNTSHRSVFWTDRAGVRRITQITETDCGLTRFETNVVDAGGTRRLEHDTILGHDGC